VILHAIQERVGLLGRFVVGLLGIGWTLATYLVVPVLAESDVGPIEAIKESAELFKEAWGETLMGQAGIGIALTFIIWFLLALGFVAYLMVKTMHSPFLLLYLEIFLFSCAMLAATIAAALSGIYRVALYRYATGTGDTIGFDPLFLAGAFIPRNNNKDLL
jgi:hypothetical protein